jgi:hypothetical protein
MKEGALAKKGETKAHSGSGRIVVARRYLTISLLSCCSVACDCPTQFEFKRRQPSHKNLRRLPNWSSDRRRQRVLRKVELKRLDPPSRYAP